MIGHSEHDEVIGTLGVATTFTQVVGSQAEVEALTVPDPNRVAYLTQTTLSLDETRDIIAALRKKYPNIKGPAAQDICYATENRQTAVKHVASEADLLLVVGSDNSSNSKRLVEVSRSLQTTAHLIDSYRDIKPAWLEDVKTIALTAGASAPECLVEEVVKYLASKGFDNAQEVEVMPENVRFGLPPEIVEAIASAPATANVE
jgi:4-hydroxy-3-methylbut-2-enyl diphosphate reductase